MIRENQSDQVQRQSPQNQVVKDIIGSIDINQKRETEQSMDITKNATRTLQNNQQVTQDSIQQSHSHQQTIDIQNLLQSNQTLSLQTKHHIDGQDPVQNPLEASKDCQFKKRDLKYSEKKEFPNQIDLNTLSQLNQGHDQIISQNNNFQIPQNIQKQVVTQTQHESQPSQQVMDPDASEDIDIMKMMKEPHSAKSETEKSHKNLSTTFQKHQTRVLQKWFLDNIQHPYLKKDDKIQLANETGLTKKQITGWFTNNRKRKYQKVAVVAKKKNKDFNYVREIIKMKFDKDLDQSLSSGTDNAGDTDSKKQSEVTHFANKLWGNEPDKNQIINQLKHSQQNKVMKDIQGMVNKSQMELNQKTLNPGDSKNQIQQPTNKDIQINLNELLGKRVLVNNQSGSAGNINNQSQFQLQAKNILNSQNFVPQSKQELVPQLANNTGKSQSQTPQQAIVSGQHTNKMLNTGSQFTFNGTFDNLTTAQAQQVQDTSQTAQDLLRDNENMHASKILENLQKLFHNQKVNSFLAPNKEKESNKDEPNSQKHRAQSQGGKVSEQLGDKKKTPNKSSENDQSMLSQKIKYIPILYVKCPQTGTPSYEPLFDLRQQINQYLQFFFKQKESRSPDNLKQIENSDEIKSGSDQTDSQNRQQQINQIEDYVDSFLKNFIGQTQGSNQSPSPPKEITANKIKMSMQSNTNMQQSTNAGGSVINPTQVQMSQIVSGSSQNDMELKKFLLTTLKGSHQNIKESQNINQNNIQKFQTLPMQKEGNKLTNANENLALQNLNEKRGIENIFKLCDPELVQNIIGSQNLKKGDPQNNQLNQAVIQKNYQNNQYQKIQQQMGVEVKGQNQGNDQLNKKLANKNLQKNTGGQFQSQHNSTNNGSIFIGAHNSSSGIHSGHQFGGSLNFGYPSSQSNPHSNPNSNQQNSNQGDINSGSNGSKKSQQQLQVQNDSLKMDKKAISQQNLQDHVKCGQNEQKDRQNEPKNKQTVQQKMRNAETPEVGHKNHQNMLGSGQLEEQQLNSDKLARKPQKLDQANGNGSKEQQDVSQADTEKVAEAIIYQLAQSKRNSFNSNDQTLLTLLDSFFKAYGNTNNTENGQQFNNQAALNLVQGLKHMYQNSNHQETALSLNNEQPAAKSSSKKQSDESNFQVEPILKSNSTYQIKSASLQRMSANQNMMDQLDNNQNYSSQINNSQLQQNLLSQMQNQQNNQYFNDSSPNNFFSAPDNNQLQHFMSQINSQYNQPRNMNNFDSNNFAQGNLQAQNDLIGLQNMQIGQSNSDNQVGGFKGQYAQNQQDINQTQQHIQQNFPGFNQYQNLFGNPNIDMGYQQQKQPTKEKSRQNGGSNQPDLQSDCQFDNIYMGSSQMNNQKLNTQYPGQQNGYYNNMHQQ